MLDVKRVFNSAISSILSLRHHPRLSPDMSSLRLSTTEKAPKGLSLDKQYYIPGGDLHFKVERTLFRVHSYFFSRESPQYRERMAGVDHAKTNDGRNDKAAILVGNTTVEDFSKFLWIFYNPDYTFDSTPASVWCTILELSSPLKWDFPKIHALALKQLADLQLPLVDRIVLYRKCSITIDRLLPLYADLCLREEPLTLEESVRLGYEFSVPISQVRERVLRRRGKAVDDNNQSLGMGSTPDDLEFSKEQVIELVKSALKTTEALSSIRDLQKPPECLTAQQDVRDQFQSQVKSSMRASSSKHATMINLDGQATTTESTNQNNSRSALSSSKGKAPEDIQMYSRLNKDQEQQRQQRHPGCCEGCPCSRPNLKKRSGFILVEKSVSIEENLLTSYFPGSWV